MTRGNLADIPVFCKTSICKALAQKLTIRLSDAYPHGGILIEVNSHSLFSKWFSESGKLVLQMFEKIRHEAHDPDRLVIVLIDEVESLTAARRSSMQGNEPSDAYVYGKYRKSSCFWRLELYVSVDIRTKKGSVNYRMRVVNALLTQLDRIRFLQNVLVVTTTNISEAIDVAFVDRADMKVFIGPPSLYARYAILRSCVKELQRVRCDFWVDSHEYNWVCCRMHSRQLAYLP